MSIELCKVKHDGAFIRAFKYTNISTTSTSDIIDDLNNGKKKDYSYNLITVEYLDRKINKTKDYFVNEWAEKNFPGKKGRKPNEPYLDLLRDKFNEIYQNIKYDKSQGRTDYQKGNIISDILKVDNEIYEQYKHDILNCPFDFILTKVRDLIKTNRAGVYRRKSLFRTKANNNLFNYFVTFTYDDKKIETEEEFREKLKKTLQNYHTRKGWKYMGVFERGEKNNRTHFHSLIYIPKGKIPGTFRKDRNWSISSKMMRTVNINTYFEERFGRNDFIPIFNKNSSEFKYLLNYICKYLNIEDERAVYARGIPSYRLALIDFDHYALIPWDLELDTPYFILSQEAPIDYINEKLLI